MSGGWTVPPQFVNATDIGTTTASSQGTNVTPSSTANTKGSYAQLTSSTGVDAAWMVVHLTHSSTSANDIISVDIAIGASGSEIIIAHDLRVDGTGFTDNPLGSRYAFPVCIPKGTRIAARAQTSSTGTTGVGVWVQLFDSDFTTEDLGSGLIDTYGFTSTTTLGTTIDPGGTANTKGSFTQLVASTTNDLAGFFLAFDNQNQAANTVAFQALLDIAIGASGSEKVICPNMPLYVLKDASNDVAKTLPICTEIIWTPIPSGTRLSARGQASIATATTRLWGVTLYGVRA